ncbi:uncharacterized protein LOC142353007 isoform X2 [Convolutriloba macropyga]|uniref:uncharacterized protein LOC142353007 isoform X2 n=1 Tax=Convolutriloba macropyga TaxID=536237 RepID=UPI003F51F20C
MLYSSAGSSSNVNGDKNMDLNAVYAAFERTSAPGNNPGMFKKTSYSQNDLTNVGRNPTTSRLTDSNNVADSIVDESNGLVGGRRSKMYLRPVSASSVENDDEYSSDTRYLTDGISGNRSTMMMIPLTGLEGGDKKADLIRSLGYDSASKVPEANLDNCNSVFDRIPSVSAGGRKIDQEGCTPCKQKGKTAKKKIKKNSSSPKPTRKKSQEKKKSVGSNSGSNPVAPKLAGNSGTGQGNKSSNSEYVAAISRPATCKSGMETTAATTAAMQLLSKGSVSSTPATAALNLRKLSIKSASSINNVTPAVKRRKSSKRSGGANSGSGGSAVSA